MKIRQSTLIAKLAQLDERLLNLWVDENPQLNDDDRWEIFALLLETRVEILKVLRDAGVRMSSEMCMPPWLERLTSRKREVRLRELKTLADEKKKRAKVAVYQGMADNQESENP